MKKPNIIFPGERLSYLKTAKPSSALSNYVNSYFEVYLNSSHDELTWHTSLPTLTTQICINLDGPGWGYVDRNGHRQMIVTSKFIGHTLDVRNNLHHRGMHNFFISLKPGFSGILLRAKPKKLHNENVDLEVLFKQSFIEEKLCEASGFEERIRITEQFLIDQIRQRKISYKYEIVQKGLNLLSNNEYLEHYSLDKICKELCVSYSTLYRHFMEITNYSAKFVEKIIKFKKGAEQYKRYGYNFNHWEYGFSDFSHFVKVSKQLTNVAPSKLLSGNIEE